MATLATAQPVASSHLPCGCRSPGQPSLLSQAAESEAEQPGLELEPTCNAGTTGLESASPWSSAFTQRLVNSFPALLAKCQTYMYKHAYVYIWKYKLFIFEFLFSFVWKVKKETETELSHLLVQSPHNVCQQPGLGEAQARKEPGPYSRSST